MGAAKWPLQERIDFANDVELNLLAVDGGANASKSDQGPGEWLPLNEGYRCDYVSRYLQVAIAYDLAITVADRGAVSTAARSCPVSKPRP